MNIAEAIEFINGMRTFQEAQAARHAAHSTRAAGYLERAEKLTEVAKLLSSIQEDGPSQNYQSPASSAPNLNLTPEDLRDLPNELLAQLSVTPSDFLDFQIVDIIDEAGGAMSLDQLIIALYRNTNTIHERSKLNSRLYRMSKKGLVKSIEGRKGIYATQEVALSEDPLEDDHGEESSP